MARLAIAAGTRSTMFDADRIGVPAGTWAHGPTSGSSSSSTRIPRFFAGRSWIQPPSASLRRCGPTHEASLRPTSPANSARVGGIPVVWGMPRSKATAIRNAKGLFRMSLRVSTSRSFQSESARVWPYSLSRSTTARRPPSRFSGAAPARVPPAFTVRPFAPGPGCSARPRSAHRTPPADRARTATPPTASA